MSMVKLIGKFYWLVVVLLMTLSVAVIVACGGRPATTSDSTSGASAAPTPTQVPASKELVDPRLKVSMAAPTHQVTVPYQTFQSSSGALHNLYDFLVGRDRKTSAAENTHLATDWSVTPDGRTWTFNLKKGIPYYQNGKASDKYFFTTDDVRHTWLLESGTISDKAYNTGTYGPLIKTVDDIEIVDEDTIIWHLDVVYPDLAYYLSEEWTFGMINKKYWDEVGGEEGYSDAPIGTGAYSFVEYVTNEHFLLEKNSDHYRKTPEFDELQFLWIKEPATIMAMLLADEVHIGQVPSDLHDQLEARGMKVAKSTLPSFHVWGVIPWYLPKSHKGEPTPNYDETVPTRDSRVRHALNMAIDRNLINDSFFKSDAMPSAVSHFAEWWDFFKDEWAPFPGPDGKTGSEGGWPYPYDPEGARDLLAEAGYSDGFDLRFYAPSNLGGVPEVPDIGEAMASMWEEIGINVDLQVTEYSIVSQMQSSRELNGSVQLIRWSLNPPSPGMSWIWRKAGRPYYEYPFITEWKENYDQIADPVERERLSQDLGDYWHNEHLSIPLLWVFGKAVYNPDVLVEYEVSHVHFGPVRYHEYTEAVYK